MKSRQKAPGEADGCSPRSVQAETQLLGAGEEGGSETLRGRAADVTAGRSHPNPAPTAGRDAFTSGEAPHRTAPHRTAPPSPSLSSERRELLPLQFRPPLIAQPDPDGESGAPHRCPQPRRGHAPQPGWPPRSARAAAAAAPPRRPRSNGPRPPHGAQPIAGRLRGGARPLANPTPPSAAASQWLSESSSIAPPLRRRGQSPGGRFSGGGRACARTAPQPIRRALRPRERSCSPANQRPARLRALPSPAQALRGLRDGGSTWCAHRGVLLRRSTSAVLCSAASRCHLHPAERTPVIESQNGWVGRDLKDHEAPTPCLQAGPQPPH